jgi:hypothetical protein
VWCAAAGVDDSLTWTTRLVGLRLMMAWMKGLDEWLVYLNRCEFGACTFCYHLLYQQIAYLSVGCQLFVALFLISWHAHEVAAAIISRYVVADGYVGQVPRMHHRGSMPVVPLLAS